METHLPLPVTHVKFILYGVQIHQEQKTSHIVGQVPEKPKNAEYVKVKLKSILNYT